MRRRRLAWLVLFPLAGGLSAADHAGWFGWLGDDRTRYQDAEATVVYAADGDTIDIEMKDRRRAATRIRLWGVDCPETAHAPGERDAYFGPEAAAFVREHVVGHRVRVILEPAQHPRDKYGRLLAYVYLLDADAADADAGQADSNGCDRLRPPECLNEMLLAKGLAYADRRFDHVMRGRFERIEQEAKRAGAGLWKDVKPEQMPAWKRRMESSKAPK